LDNHAFRKTPGVRHNIMNRLLLIIFYLFIFVFASSQKGNTLNKIDTFKVKPNDRIIVNKKLVSDSTNLQIYLIDKQTQNTFKDILPILTLLLGIILNRLLDLYTDYRKIKKTGERWKAELTCLDDPMKNQIKYLEEFLVEHNKEVYSIPRIVVSEALSCESFSALDKSELIKYIEKFKSKKYNEAVSDANKINSFIGVLKNHSEHLKNKFESYLSGTSKHIGKLNESLQSFLKSFAEYQLELEKEIKADPINDPRYRPILDLVNEQIIPYMQNGDYDIYVLEQNFYFPLIDILSELRLDSRVNEMSEQTRNAINSIKGVKVEKRYLTEILTTLIKRYQNSNKDLVDLLKKL